MVYHLRNWKFLRDWFATAPPRYNVSTIASILNELQLPVGDKYIIEDIVKSCGKAISQEGFEACLITGREDISPAFRGPGFNEKFEEFLRKLDEKAGEMKKTFYEEHKL